jgi:hypothetical protein
VERRLALTRAQPHAADVPPVRPTQRNCLRLTIRLRRASVRQQETIPIERFAVDRRSEGGEQQIHLARVTWQVHLEVQAAVESQQPAPAGGPRLHGRSRGHVATPVGHEEACPVDHARIRARLDPAAEVDACALRSPDPAVLTEADLHLGMASAPARSKVQLKERARGQVELDTLAGRKVVGQDEAAVASRETHYRGELSAPDGTRREAREPLTEADRLTGPVLAPKQMVAVPREADLGRGRPTQMDSVGQRRLERVGRDVPDDPDAHHAHPTVLQTHGSAAADPGRPLRFAEIEFDGASLGGHAA